MALNETFRATVIAEVNTGQAIVFDYGYQQQSAGSEHLDTGTAAGDFQTLVQATLAAALPTGLTFKKYRFACVGGTHVGEIGFVVVDPAVTGAQDSDPLPLEIALSMKRSTGHASRRDRGRVFFGPIVEDLRDTGNSDKPLAGSSQLSDVCNLGKADLTTGGVTLRPVLLSGDGTTTGHVITTVEVGDVFVHHKSRRLRVGV